MDSSFNLAVHALVCLSHSGRSLSSEALAENICTNPARVRRVLAGLKKAGMVETREGLDGGYRLCADPAALSLRQVAEAVNTRFVDCAWHSGDIDRDCAICSGMAGVMDGLYRQLNGQCAAYLSHITVADIENRLFAKGSE
ncbi:MAG: RrF2 family transcriptional regulator [Christensenellales bacterium]